jgi:hypothetical protein
MAINLYWMGTKQASLRADQVTAKWISDPTCRVGLEVLNKAFEIFYCSRKSIQACPHSADRAALTVELEDAANSGWGFGVHDMDDAFAHLEKNKGGWTDGLTEQCRSWSIYQVHLGWAPTSAVNFLTALDKKVEESRNAADALIKDANNLPDILGQSQKDWNKVHETLENMKKRTGWAKRILCFKPVAKKVGDGAGEMAGAVGDGVEALDGIASAIEDYDRATRAGMSRNEALALTALKKIAEKVPVFGEGYAAVIGGIPNTMELVRGWHDRTMVAIESAR